MMRGEGVVEAVRMLLCTKCSWICKEWFFCQVQVRRPLLSSP